MRDRLLDGVGQSKAFSTIADFVVVTGKLRIPASDGLLHFSAVASELLCGKLMAPAVKYAVSDCLCRAYLLLGLGIDL